MENDFDVSAAVDEIGSGLGLDLPETTSDDVELDVTSPAADPEVTADTEVKVEPTTSEEPAAPTTPAADAAPKTWRKEAAATWAALPSEAKNEILKREADIFSGIESYKADAGFGKSIKTAITPYEQILRDNNMDPAQTITSLMATHHTLATGTPQARLDLFTRMAKEYGIPLPTGEASSGEPPYIDPAVAALQTELSSVKSTLEAQTQRAAAEQRNLISKQIDAFATDPSNIYWADVADSMAVMLESRQASTLQEAYDKAIWTNPAVRAKEIARQTAEATAKAQAASEEKVKAAKQATAANVKASAKVGSATTPKGSLDDTLAAAMANIKARA